MKIMNLIGEVIYCTIYGIVYFFCPFDKWKEVLIVVFQN